jgi:serpin B
VEKRLSDANLDSWLSRLDRRTVDLKVPRFKVEGEYELSATLRELGMQRAFTSPDQPGGAQFSGMSASDDPTKQLFIAAVRHKAWVDVNEEGTEAAAATAVLMAAGSAAPDVRMAPFTPEFHADRPFMFLIRDGKSGLVLFMGRMVNPRAGMR